MCTWFRRSSEPTTWGTLDRPGRLEQFKLIYDYIKFHLGLYLATPPVFSIVAEAFSVKEKNSFRIGLGLMIVTYIFSGAHASTFMARYINIPWQEGDSFLRDFETKAFSKTRRRMHHGLYWTGVVFGIVGLGLAILNKYAKLW